MPSRFDPQGAANFSFPTSGSKVSAITVVEQQMAQVAAGSRGGRAGAMLEHRRGAVL